MHIQHFAGERPITVELLANGIAHVRATKVDGEYHRLVVTPHEDASNRLATPEVAADLRDQVAAAIEDWQTPERVAAYNALIAARRDDE